MTITNDKDAQKMIDNRYFLDDDGNPRGDIGFTEDPVLFDFVNGLYGDDLKGAGQPRSSSNPPYYRRAGLKYFGYRATARLPKNAPDRPTIRKIHFCYMRLDKQGGLVVRNYFYKRPNGDVITDQQIEGIVSTLALQGRIGTGHDSEGFEIAEDEPCYLCFLMDEVDWEFLYRDQTKKTIDGLHFATRSAGFMPNRTFLNGGHFDVNMVKSPKLPQMRTVLWCENHLLKSWPGEWRKRDQDDEAERYKLDLIFRVSYDPPKTDNNGNELRETIVVDPGGKNIGP